MSARSVTSEHDDADRIKAITDRIKIILSTLRESRQEDERLTSLQNEPYIDVWCDKVIGDAKDQDQPSSLKSVVLDFLQIVQEKVKTLNVFGEAGAGKSASMLKLESTLWDFLDVEKIGLVPQFFPVFMILKTVTYPMYHGLSLREVALHSLGNILTLDDLDELEQLKSQLKLSPVWLLDGFDEMGRLQPLCIDLFECGISIVTCRQQFLDSVLGGNFEKFLTPKDSHGQKQGRYEQIKLQPFSEEQIEHYVSEWVDLSVRKGSNNIYKAHQLMNVINRFPSLKELSCNPYLLTLLCTVMHTFAEKYPNIKAVLIAPESMDHMDQCEVTDLRFGISDVLKELVDALMAKGMSRFANQIDWTQKRFDAFPLACQHFCEDTAFKMFEAKEKTYTIDLRSNVENKDSKDYDQPFGIDEFSPPLDFILQSVPLRKIGDSSLYAFSHKSLWEYFLACRSMRLPLETLGHELFTQDRDLLLIHAELLSRREGLVESYIKLVINSKQKCEDRQEDIRRVTSASNALSILNFAAADSLIPFQFEDIRDWKGIRVPGVNLNYAKILRCEFDGADLSNASLICALVFGSSFRHVDLRGATSGIKTLLNGPANGMSSIAMHTSLDGTILASASNNESVRIWNIETGDCKFVSPRAERVWDSPMHSIVAFTSWSSKCIFLWNTAPKEFCGVLEGHTNSVFCFCFSPDGKTGASSSVDNTIKIWRIADRTCLQTLRANAHFDSLTFSPDGNKLVSALFNKICFFDLSIGKRTKTIKTDYAANLLYHPDGKQIVKFCKHKPIIEILNADTGKNVSSMNVGENITKICFLPNGQLIIIAKGLKVWDIESNTCQRILDSKNDANITFALSHDSTTLVTVSPKHDVVGDTDDDDEKTIEYVNNGSLFTIWDVKNFQLVSFFESSQEIPKSICISHDNAFILTTYSTSETFSLWDIKHGEETKIYLGVTNFVGSLSFLRDSSQTTLASMSNNNFRLWRKDNGDAWECFNLFQSGIESYKSTLSPDGKLIVGSQKGKLVMFDCEKKKIIRTLKVDCRWPSCVFSPDGSLFVCFSFNVNELDIYETATRKRLRRIDTNSRCSYASFSSDGRILACVLAGEGGIRLINIATGESHLKIKGHSSEILYHPTKNHVLASQDDVDIKLWDTLTGKCLMTLAGHVNIISSFCFSPDGSTLASAAYNGSILVWDLTSKNCLPNISSNSSGFQSICLNHDARILAAGGKGLHVYDVETGKLISTLISTKVEIDCVSFNPDGSLLVCCLGEEQIEIWDMRTNTSIEKFIGSKPRFNPKSNTILYINDAICIWDVAQKKRSFQIQFVEESDLNYACFSDDGSMIVATFSASYHMHFWSAATGKRIKKRFVCWDGVDFAISPKGDMMMLSGSNCLIISEIEKRGKHCGLDDIGYARFSPDGSKIAFILGDYVVLYDLETLKVIVIFEGHSGCVESLYYHPSGRYLVSCCRYMIFVWDLETMQPRSILGFNKCLRLECDLEGAQLDQTFQKIISSLNTHLFPHRKRDGLTYTIVDKQKIHNDFDKETWEQQPDEGYTAEEYGDVDYDFEEE